MKPSLLLCLFLLSAASLFSQSYTRVGHICNDGAYDEFAGKQASAIDSDNNLYTIGYTPTPMFETPDSVYVRKYSPAGKLLWEVFEPYANASEYYQPLPVTLSVSKAGDVVISYSRTFAKADLDAVVSKYNNAGKKLWQTVFDGPGTKDNEQLRTLNTDAAGNAYLLVAENDFFAAISKVSSAGSILWSREIRGQKREDIDAYTGFLPSDATIDSSGNMYISGASQRVKSGTDRDAVIYKYRTNGDSAWTRLLGQLFSYNQGGKIRYAKQDNSVIMCGIQDLYSTDSALVVKYTASGKPLWKFKSACPYYSYVAQAVIDAGNNILFSTSTVVTPTPKAPILTKLSPSGTVLWLRLAFDVPAGSSNIIFDLKTDADNNVYAIGNADSTMVIVKYDPLGNPLFDTREGTGKPKTQVIYGDLNVTKSQDMYVTATYQSNRQTITNCNFKYKLNKTGLVADEASAIPAAAPRLLPAALLYPNPARSEVNLSAASIPAGSNIRVFDATGRQVLQKKLSAGQTRIDVSTLPSGLYTLQLLTGAESSTYKFIKE